MSTMRRQQRAIEGNTARKVQTLEYPSRERQPERRERRHEKKQCSICQCSVHDFSRSSILHGTLVLCQLSAASGRNYQ